MVDFFFGLLFLSIASFLINFLYVDTYSHYDKNIDYIETFCVILSPLMLQYASQREYYGLHFTPRLL